MEYDATLRAKSRQTSASASDVALAELLTPAEPNYDQIALRAFLIFEQSGRQHGHCEDNWHLAKKCLFVESQAALWARDWRQENAQAKYEYSLPQTHEINQTMPSMNASGMSQPAGS